jgi:hypothetical protein
MRDLFGPSLTMAQLRDIQARRSGDDILVLLWEIKRLHVVLKRADQLTEILRHSGGIEGQLLRALREELVCFEVLKEWRAERVEMLTVERDPYQRKRSR